jgi:hypothetical protein
MSNARDLANIADDASDIVQGTAKAWVNFDGTTNTGGNCDITESYNVSSVADNGTGQYTVTFANNFADVNYSAVCSGGATGTLPNFNRTFLVHTTSVSSFDMRVQQSDSGVLRDEEIIVAVVFR